MLFEGTSYVAVVDVGGEKSVLLGYSMRITFSFLMG